MMVPLTASARGPCGVDYTLRNDNSVPRARNREEALIDFAAINGSGGSLVLGSQNKLGVTFWRSLDSTVAATLLSPGCNLICQRIRPSQRTIPTSSLRGLSTRAFRAERCRRFPARAANGGRHRAYESERTLAERRIGRLRHRHRYRHLGSPYKVATDPWLAVRRLPNRFWCTTSDREFPRTSAAPSSRTVAAIFRDTNARLRYSQDLPQNLEFVESSSVDPIIGSATCSC